MSALKETMSKGQTADYVEHDDAPAEIVVHSRFPSFLNFRVSIQIPSPLPVLTCPQDYHGRSDIKLSFRLWKQCCRRKFGPGNIQQEIPKWIER